MIDIKLTKDQIETIISCIEDKKLGTRLEVLSTNDPREFMDKYSDESFSNLALKQIKNLEDLHAKMAFYDSLIKKLQKKIDRYIASSDRA